MNGERSQKVTASHLKRNAYLYVRQSTLRQVFENTESTKRQYALQQRAVALGWPLEQVVVIDSDLGQSGASAADRLGFQRLVTEVGIGRAGIVIGLEVSRLARNSADWHRLLEICALTDTLIMDEDGIYDPSHFNDRLLLGMKGTMSEAELHVLKARLQGGILSKARRGELKGPLPVGLEYGPDGRVGLDPDQQVQQAIHLFFRTFRRTGSASGTVRAFREQGVRFPRRVRSGAHKGELLWGPLLHCRALQTLKNPRYAGAFFYGRSHIRKTVDNREITDRLPREQWHALIPGAHAGYVSWVEYEDNLARLRGNAQAYGKERRSSPPREGPALLQGLVICGRCGERMTVRYHGRGDCLAPVYVCQKDGIEHGSPPCQSIPGLGVDEAIGELLVATVTPLALEVALMVQQELIARGEEANRLRQQQVERARYEAELAQRRYLRVDPDNRLVASTLEADWNQKLRALAETQEEYEHHCQADRQLLSEQERAEILNLATDFPRLWCDQRTPQRERKRMVRLMLEDVTLLKGDRLAVHVRFRGGISKSLDLPRPLSAWQMRQTDPAVVKEVDRLLPQHTDGQIAAILNERGFRSGTGKPFHRLLVADIRLTYDLTDRYTRFRAQGMLTKAEMAARLGISTSLVKAWRQQGLLVAHAYNDKNEYLYALPPEDLPAKWSHKKDYVERRRHTTSIESRERGAV